MLVVCVIPASDHISTMKSCSDYVNYIPHPLVIFKFIYLQMYIPLDEMTFFALKM